MSNLRQTFFILLLVAVHFTFGDGLNIPRVNKKNLSRQQIPTKETEPEENPCNFKEFEKPSFNAPGRRISEAKCYEYIWEMRKREYYFKKNDECSEYKRRHSYVKHYHAIGGRRTKPGEFPHMGALGWRAINGTWIFICGSSLISNKFMLTAAHCSKVSSRYPNIANPRPEIVRLGDKNILDKFFNGRPTQDAKIKRIVVHSQYASPKKYFDIAIIELQDAVVFSKFLQPACLWTKFDTSFLGRKATLTGWGIIEVATLRRPPELQAAVVDILSSKICDNLLKRNRLWGGMTENQLCAGKLSGGVDACQGDSGGPLQVKINLRSTNEGTMNFLIGVTSFGIGCAQANTPGVYTRVSSFINWVEDVVWSGPA